MVRRIGALVAILLTWTGSASAQDANGHVEGRVLTPDARPATPYRRARQTEEETDNRPGGRASAPETGPASASITFTADTSGTANPQFANVLQARP
jgi:hypothetical protein